MSKITIDLDDGMIYDRDEKIRELRADRDEKIKELKELQADMDHYRNVVLGRIGRPEIGLTREQIDMIKAVVP